MEPVKRTTDHEAMPKIEFGKDGSKLTFTELSYMKRAEIKNIERAVNSKVLRKRNNFLGLALGLGVFGVYSYTMYAVKQETFLDDFDEPETIIESNPSKSNQF